MRNYFQKQLLVEMLHIKYYTAEDGPAINNIN